MKTTGHTSTAHPTTASEGSGATVCGRPDRITRTPIHPPPTTRAHTSRRSGSHCRALATTLVNHHSRCATNRPADRSIAPPSAESRRSDEDRAGVSNLSAGVLVQRVSLSGSTSAARCPLRGASCLTRACVGVRGAGSAGQARHGQGQGRFVGSQPVGPSLGAASRPHGALCWVRSKPADPSAPASSNLQRRAEQDQCSAVPATSAGGA